jgi:hypothetical protein
MQQFPAVTASTAQRREATEMYRLERRANKNVANENDLYYPQAVLSQT